MVAFSASDIPNTINTIEALNSWTSSILNYLHFQQEIQKAPDVVEKGAVSQAFPVNNNGVSNAIGQTLFSGISTALDAFGVQDSDNTPL